MNYLGILRMDSRTLEEEYRIISSTLRRFGLSDYEARTYIALVAMDHGSAENIGETAGVPRTSAYKVLQSLEGKGFVTSVGGRPTIFRPVPPPEVKSSLIEEVSDALDGLDEIRGTLGERVSPHLVYTIAGKDRVLAKIGEILDSSFTDFIISSPMMKAIQQVHSQRFRDAVGRGVEVIVLTEPFVKVPECTRVHRKRGLLATDVFSDGEMALIASPDLSVCGYSDNQFLVKHLEGFLLTAIEHLEGERLTHPGR